MKIVRLRARAILALALCALGALAVMKALSDNVNIGDDIGAPIGGREPSAQRHKSDRREGEAVRVKMGEALVGDRAAPGAPAVGNGQEQQRTQVDRQAFYDVRQQPNVISKSVSGNEDAKNIPDKPLPRVQPPAAEPNNRPANIDQSHVDGNRVQEVPSDENSRRLRVDGAAVANAGGDPLRQQQPAQAGQRLTSSVVRLVNSTGYPTLVNGKFVPQRRIVHLDLKGAAPKLYYFEKFFQMISRLGATGILIEWEDTFPYTGDLIECRSGRAYSESDIRTILGWARANNLEVIPLVQTFGHLEWILKHPKFAHLREVDRYAQVICPTNQEAVKLVKMAIDQVMALHHPLDGGEFFHMGADEAFQIGMCERCMKAIREQFNNNREKLMVKHITTIAEYIKTKYNRRVLMWHDMLNNVDSQTMKESKMGELVEPVVWAYAENLNDYLMPDMWQRFAQTFPYIWSASAYKGADGPTRYYSNIPHYLQNHISWGQQMTREYKNFKEFRGIILTGWQRFDHFAVLCELLPVGVPSLAVNLQVVVNGGDYNRQIVGQTSRLLECSSQLDVDSPGIAGYCQFPGSRIYQYVQQLKMSQQNLKQNLLDDFQLRGWLSQFNIVHNYSSAWYLDQVADKVMMSLNDLQSLSRALRTELSKVFEEDTVDEFLMEYLEPDIEHLQKLFNSAKRIGQIRTFPARPFPIVGINKPPAFVTSQDARQQSNQADGNRPPGPPGARPGGV